MAATNKKTEPSSIPENDDDDDEEEEEDNDGDDDDEEEEEDDDDEEENFHISASSSAPFQLPILLHNEPQPIPASSPLPESTSRALVPFTGSFPAIPFLSSKPAIEASTRNNHQAFKASTDSHPQASTDVKPAIHPAGKLPAKLDADLEPERKGESREHKKRSKNWTRAETLTLISLRTELAHRFAKAGRKSELWDEIAESLQKGSFSRDAQQCRDKWEKLMAGYKEVRDGVKHKDDNPYYEDLYPLLSGRILKREREQDTISDYPTSKVEPFKSSIPLADVHHAHQPHQFQPFRTLPVDGHYTQPFKTVVMDGHHHPHQAFKPLAMDGYHHHPSLRTLAMDGHHHPPPPKTLAMDGPPHLPFRGSHTEGHHQRPVAMDNHATPADEDDASEGRDHTRKQRRVSTVFSMTDLHAIQSLLEPIIARQQSFFKELLDAIERKEELREQMRQEREEKWRAEERSQRIFFTEAMQILTQRLGTSNGVVEPATIGVAVPLSVNHTPPVGSPMAGPKRRSKNWKRSEVLQLIKLRGEMEDKFVKSIRRAALWGDLAEMLCNQGIRRDGKQCREKWDKLMAEYKDVLDGKKEKGDSPYYPELQIALAGGGPERQGDEHMSGISSKEEETPT